MASARMRTVVRRLRQTAWLETAGLSDGALLERYLASRDEAAFAALVRRHGPMVLGVCRRILRDPHDADDAFQATFLVLVRKAHTVLPRERVAAWLYGVAYRIALKAKAMNSRRRARQKSLADVAGPTPPTDDWLALLDREIERLPEKYRLPIVLCDLEGQTRKQAARALNWPEGTVATRLQRGRELVQKRLARLGLALSVGVTTLAWTESVAAQTLPAALASATVKIAALVTAGKAAGVVSLKVLALAQGVVQAMVIGKVKCVLAVALTLGLLGIAGVNGSRLAAGAQPPTGTAPQYGLPPRAAPPPPALAKSPVSIEKNDSRLPTGPLPVQALVSLDRDKVVVKTNQPTYIPRQASNAEGQSVTMYEASHLLRADRYDRSEVEVYDTQRRKLDTRDMGKWLKQEIPALLLAGTRHIDPLHLRLIKDGTLIFVVPGRTAATVPAVPATAPAPSDGPRDQDPFLPPAPPPAPVQEVPGNTAPTDQAKREWAIVEFYTKASHFGSAAFYAELMRRRYPNTGYAQKAGDLLRKLQRDQLLPLAADPNRERVGEIIIVDNRQVPDAAILKNCPIFPGQGFEYKDVRAAQAKLDRWTWGTIDVRCRVEVVEPDRARGFKDILITVQEWRNSETEGRACVELELPRRGGDPLPITQRDLTLPVNIDPAKRVDIKALSLFWSADEGTTWKLASTIPPDRNAFDFKAPADGMYWFHVCIMDRQGKRDPRTPRPDLKVHVRTPPTVTPTPAIKVENAATGTSIMAESMTLLGDGRVKLSKCTLQLRQNGIATILRGDEVILHLDGAVQAVADLVSRRIVSLQVDGAGSVSTTK